MINEKGSLDRLIRDIIQGKFDATKKGVITQDIIDEVQSNTDVSGDEVLRWINLLGDKTLIRKTLAGSYVPVDLNAEAAKRGVLDLIRSVEEESEEQ